MIWQFARKKYWQIAKSGGVDELINNQAVNPVWQYIFFNSSDNKFLMEWGLMIERLMKSLKWKALSEKGRAEAWCWLLRQSGSKIVGNSSFCNRVN